METSTALNEKTSLLAAAFRDSRLTFRDRGVLGYMAAFPDGHLFTRKSLEAHQQGRLATLGILQRLRKCGYIEMIDHSKPYSSEVYYRVAARLTDG